jgi:hypothetical protein
MEKLALVFQEGAKKSFSFLFFSFSRDISRVV